MRRTHHCRQLEDDFGFLKYSYEETNGKKSARLECKFPLNQEVHGNRLESLKEECLFFFQWVADILEIFKIH